MKKTTKGLFFVLFSCASMLSSAFAQVVSVSAQFYAPHAVVVKNATDDGRTVSVTAGRINFLLPHGEHTRLGYSSVFGSGSGEHAVLVQICGEVKEFFLAPPEFATNKQLLGANALPIDPRELSEKEIGERVKEINKILEDKKPLGYKIEKKELARWFKSAKQLPNLIFERCDSVIASLTQYVWMGTYAAREVVLTVRGDEQRGYRLSPY